MTTPEYEFTGKCPKCGNPAMDKKFIPVESTKTEYLDCGCALCGFKCTMQTMEDMFEQMEITWRKKSEENND